MHHHTKQGKGGDQGKTEAQENYDAKAKTTKSKGDEADSPDKILAGRQF